MRKNYHPAMRKRASYRDDVTLLASKLGMEVDEVEEEIFQGNIIASGNVTDLQDVAIDILEAQAEASGEDEWNFWKIDALGDYFNFEQFAQNALSRPGFLGEGVKYYWFGTTLFTVFDY